MSNDAVIQPDSQMPDQDEQLTQQDTLISRGVEDPLDEGYVAPDHWSVAQGFGNTPAEMAQGETIEQRIKQEEPEEDPKKLTGPWNPTGEKRQVGGRRAGRLINVDGDMIDVEVSDGGAATPVSIPVLDPTGYYEDYAPEGWTPTPTPSATEEHGESEGH